MTTLAAWTQLRSINTGEHRPIVALADVAVGETHLFRDPDDQDPAVLLRVDAASAWCSISSS